MKTLYTAEALASGEGRDGTAVTKDGKLNVTLASPVELGGNGEGTNPEQLFAAGYAACFHSALRLVGRQQKADLTDSAVAAKIHLGALRGRGRIRPRRGTRDRPARRGPADGRGPGGQGPRGLPLLQRHPRQHHCRHQDPGGRRMSTSTETITLPATTREIQLASRPHGRPVPENFRLAETALPELQDGQVLVRNLFISVDPYMRGRMNDVKSYSKPFALDAALDGGAVGEVIASRSADR